LVSIDIPLLRVFILLRRFLMRVLTVHWLFRLDLKRLETKDNVVLLLILMLLDVLELSHVTAPNNWPRNGEDWQLVDICWGSGRHGKDEKLPIFMDFLLTGSLKRWLFFLLMAALAELRKEVWTCSKMLPYFHYLFSPDPFLRIQFLY